MSYDIFYGKQFIKLRKTGEVIPVLLSGSNNCFEVGQGGRTGRRSRSWDSFRYYNRKGKLSEKPDVLLDNIDADLRKHIREYSKPKEYQEKAKPSDIRNHWGYYVAVVVGSGYCSDTSFPQWRNFFATGIKNALTVEELVEKRVYPMFTAYGNNGQPPSIPLLTEHGYFEELKKWKAWQESHPDHHFSLCFTPYDTDAVLERLRKPKGPPPLKEQVQQDHFFTLANDAGNALIKYTSRGFRFSWHLNGGQRFRTEADAEKRRKELLDKGRYKADTWKTKRIDEACTFSVKSENEVNNG